MKDSEFIQLLNLYLDHEISAEDSACLEAEVLRDPKRQQLYRQYCQMQKACVILADKARETAPEEEPILAATFAPRPAWSGGIWTAGLLAAAACACIALIGRRSASPAAAAQPAASVAVGAPAPAAPIQEFQPVFVARNLMASDRDQPGAMFASDKGSQFAWMSQIQMAPIRPVSVDKLFSDPKPSLEFDLRPAGDRPLGADAQTAAFQFQK